MHSSPGTSAPAPLDRAWPRSRLGRRVEPDASGSPGRRLPAYVVSTLGGATIALAWLVPGTIAGAGLGWVASALVVWGLRARRVLGPAYCGGLACYALGFYWIFGTVASFGGFGAPAAALLFALYVALGAVQFLLMAAVHHHLGPTFEALALRGPTAVVLSELVSVRLFAWHFGHTQIAFTPFVQVADLGGAMLVTFLMVWLAEAVVRRVVFRERRRAFGLPVLACGLALGYGLAAMRLYASPRGETQEVVLVQGNAPLSDRLDPDSAQRELDRLCDLSRDAARRPALIVWPEGAIRSFIPDDVGSVDNAPILPWTGRGSAFLVGAFAANRRQERFNAAFAVLPDGAVPPPYFKRILIPFGEAIPFADVVPALKALNTRAGIFTPGTAVTVFQYPLRRPDGTTSTAKVAPLICYEDTVPAPASEAVRAGAELLVNLTYDTWFGRSAAPEQHHLIAAFRAIETRRYLVRATNSGLSAVVDPLGRTVARLPGFSEGVLSARVGLLRGRSVYAGGLGDRPWWALLGAGLASIAVGRRGARPGRPAPAGAAGGRFGWTR